MLLQIYILPGSYWVNFVNSFQGNIITLSGNSTVFIICIGNRIAQSLHTIKLLVEMKKNTEKSFILIQPILLNP